MDIEIERARRCSSSRAMSRAAFTPSHHHTRLSLNDIPIVSIHTTKMKPLSITDNDQAVPRRIIGS
ncbi:MAG: hypothetical protein K9G49_01760 [Taibaiella sp.]|nr:hypothetical protein [Taibaiella sp.]